jgi:hypothetical protein
MVAPQGAFAAADANAANHCRKHSRGFCLLDQAQSQLQPANSGLESTLLNDMLWYALATQGQQWHQVPTLGVQLPDTTNGHPNASAGCLADVAIALGKRG